MPVFLFDCYTKILRYNIGGFLYILSEHCKPPAVQIVTAGDTFDADILQGTDAGLFVTEPLSTRTAISV